MEHCIGGTSRPTSAIHVYSGILYAAFDAAKVRKLIHSGKLRVFIVSDGYGVLDAFERARNYNAEMKGRLAKYWHDVGLADVIRDICVTLGPNQVYGFFAG